MARQKGMLNLSGNLEPLAGAPLDSRSITPTVADLYIASNWPYKYIGMKTTVTATGDTYRLVNLDVTQESSWVKEGGESGQTIQYDELPAASSSLVGEIYQYTGTTNLQYTNGYFYECVNDGGIYKWIQTNTQPGTSYNDFTGATSQAAGAHGLVPAPTTGDISKFLKGDGTWATVPMPSFDYSNTSPEAMNFSTDEKVIGTWIDGKPLYQKTFVFTDYTLTDLDSWRFLVDVPDLHISNSCCFITNSYYVLSTGNFTSVSQIATMSGGSNNAYTKSFTIAFDSRHLTSDFSANDCLNIITSAALSNVTLVFTLRYTKTTDTAVASGEKIVGQWINGKPLYQKIVNCGALPNNTTKNVAHDISNKGQTVRIFGISQKSDGKSIQIPYTTTCEVSVDNTYVSFITTYNLSVYENTYVTIQYTKAT